MSDDNSVTVISLDDVMMTSSEMAMADEGDKSRIGEVGEGSRGSRSDGVGKTSCSERVEETRVGIDDTAAEGLKGTRMVEIASVGTTNESLSVTKMDDISAS